MKRTVISILILAGVVVAVMYYTNAWPQTGSAAFESEEGEEMETGADRSLMTWWWSRAYPEPGDINEKFFRGWMHAERMRKDPAQLMRVAAFSGNWMGIGPSQNIGGRILCIAVDPRNSNNIFAGSASGGIWRSVTGGVGSNAWQPLITGLPVLGVASIIIHPGNSDIMYAGTGEVYRTDTSNIGFNVWKARGTYGVGIIKTTNRGASWTPVFSRSMSGLFGVQMLKFDPVNPDIVYACTTDGLYRSSNAGSTWIKILNRIYVSDIAIHPTNTNQLVVAVGNLQNADKGIYRSTDGGSTWTKITSGLPASFAGFIRLDHVSTAPDMIVASIGRSAGTTQNELFRSTNFGQNWSELSNSNHCQYQFWFSHDVAINPSNTSQLVMGGVPLYRFTIPSSRTSIGGVHADIHDIEFDPSNSNIVYVACDGGVYKSTNAGGSFSMVNGGLQAVQFYASFAVSPTNPNIMIGGLQDNGVVRYNGTGWTQVAGGDGGPCAFHPTDGAIAFASNDARRVMRSTNSGSGFGTEVLRSWAFEADSRTGFMAPLAVSRSNPSVVYVASDNLHKSISGGTSGSFNGNAYTTATTFIEARHKTAVALAVSPRTPDKLYVSTSSFAQYDNDANNLHVNHPPNILKSINGGASFTSIKGSLPDRFVMDFAISPNNDDSVWVVLGGYGSSHVYVSGNGGVTWANRGVGLPDVPHNAILLDPRDPSIVYVGNDLGVYMSYDRGATWNDYNSGLWDATLVMDLVATSSNKLVAATHGKGVFVSDLFMIRLAFELLDFNGINKSDRNELYWTTALEENAQSFELERSIQGGAYERIATVPAMNAVGGSSYNYIDRAAIAVNAPVVYYRLKMIDKDGQFSYSRVVTLRAHPRTDIVVLNNPFVTEIKVSFTARASGHVTLSLFDAAGKRLGGKIFNTNAGVSLLILDNLGALPRGNYVLEVRSGKDKFAYKVIH